MIAFPGLLAKPAEAANMAVPDDLEEYDPNAFPHWHVYTMCQLGASMPSPLSHWRNAEVVAALSDDQIKTVTFEELTEVHGFEIGHSYA